MSCSGHFEPSPVSTNLRSCLAKLGAPLHLFDAAGVEVRPGRTLLHSCATATTGSRPGTDHSEPTDGVRSAFRPG